MADSANATSVGGQRILAVVILLVLGILSLPVSAYFFDGEGSENWIIPVAVALMVILGALVGSRLPGIAGADATRRRGAFIGAAVGVGMLVLGVVIFFLLLSGFDGA
jgi:hypothetical protein